MQMAKQQIKQKPKSEHSTVLSPEKIFQLQGLLTKPIKQICQVLGLLPNLGRFLQCCGRWEPLSHFSHVSTPTLGLNHQHSLCFLLFSKTLLFGFKRDTAEHNGTVLTTVRQGTCIQRLHIGRRNTGPGSRDQAVIAQR